MGRLLPTLLPRHREGYRLAKEMVFRAEARSCGVRVQQRVHGPTLARQGSALVRTC